MGRQRTTLERIVDGGVIAVLRGVDRESVVELGEALRAGGITAMEVTADTPGAVESIAALSDRFADEEAAVVGAGTVLDAATARAAVDAGAEFVVSPTLAEPVVECCNRYGVVSIPGAFTPTEALTAVEAGADLVKVFPASTGGPDHVAAIKGPLAQVPVVPTGGVGPDDAAEYVEAGAAAVGVGSALVPDGAVETGDFGTVERRARELLEAVASARD